MINFELPKDLIAQYPASPRDSARLLVYERKSKKIIDTVFKEINNYLPKGSTVVINNSKVEHCRWLFEPNLEIFVLNKLDTHTVNVLVRPGKKFKLGSTVKLSNELTAEVTGIDDDGIRTLRLSMPHNSEELDKYEHVPLPPYIMQNDDLANEYQTVYANPEGSKAAPTAGLHFTKELLSKINIDHQIAEVTLHVGLGTFAPLSDDQIKKGKLHKEYYEVNSPSAEIIRNSKHITAIGTTSARTLESIDNYSVNNISGWTDILISPGYKFKHVNSLVTNFHLPGTSLLLLVEALVGSESELQRIYSHAIVNKYRFYSFGDAMLII